MLPVPGARTAVDGLSGTSFVAVESTGFWMIE
jgi:hypothetical protein